MRCRGIRVAWLGLLAGVLWANVPALRAQEPTESSVEEAVPLEQVPAGVRERVRRALEKPTFHARGPVENFSCRPYQYHWLLDHPDRAVDVWRRLGARTVEISQRENGRFGWRDNQGSDVSWDTVYRGPTMRIWYAEGKVRVGSLLPMVPIQVVVVLRYSAGDGGTSPVVMQHQAELALYTDSRTAALVARVVGASAPRLGEQYVAQLEMFYSVLAWYFDQNPQQVEPLLTGTYSPAGRTQPAARAWSPLEELSNADSSPHSPSRNGLH